MLAKIVDVQIGPMPKTMGDPMPKVTVLFDNGEVKDLFYFYPDEIMFAPDEFMGLTEEQAWTLKYSKDTAYLRS